MKIEILGGGCAKCSGVHKTVRQAVSELGIQADIEAVMDLERLANYHTLTLPTLVIDGVPQHPKGKLSLETVKKLLK